MTPGLKRMSDGYNTRVEYQGAGFNVQTQDKGLAAHYVESFVYKSGKLLTTKKTFYTAFLNSPNLKKMIDQIMKEQHQTIIQEIEDGKFDRFLGKNEGMP